MLTTFDYLPKKQQEKLVELVQKIVKTVNPAKIICYGHRRSITKDWSCFFPDSEGLRTVSPTFDLLILTSEEEKQDDHVIIQKIEQESDALPCEVTTIVHKQSTANDLIKKGSRFWGSIYRNGVLLYDKGGIALTEPSDEPEFSVLKRKIETAWEKSFEIAKRFLKSGNDCLYGDWPEQAMFNYHQAMQHTCMAILRAYTGYRSTTHNLSRLLALTENFTFRLSVLFPCITKEETELFNSLNRAYSDARYSEDYVVTKERAKIIQDRVCDFLSTAEKIYKERLLTLENNKPVTFPLSI